MPEPSPLFWDHLSSRVSRSGGGGAEPRALAGSTLVARVRVAAACRQRGGRAALVVAVVVGTLAPSGAAPARVASAAAVADAGARPNCWTMRGDDDASLTLVAELADDLDLETAREAGLAPRGSAEHAVTHLTTASGASCGGC